MTAGRAARAAGATDRTGWPLPAAVWLLCALQLAGGLAWSVLTPPLRGPDEPAHVDLAWQVARSGPAWFDPEDTELTDAVLAALPRRHAGAELDPDVAYVLLDPAVRDTRIRAGSAPPRAARVPLAALADGPAEAHVNQMAAHPVPPYLLGGAVLAAAPADTPADAHLWLVRAVAALSAAPLPALAYAATRRAGGGSAAARTAAALVLGVPMLTHLAGTFSNDLPLATLGGVLAVGLARLATGDAGGRTALVLGAAIGAGALVKAFALIWPLAVVAAGGVAWRSRGASAAAVARCLALTAALAGAVGGWWWLRNLVVYGTLQPGGGLYDDGPPAVDAAEWAVLAVSRLPLRFFGQFGWSEVALPWPLVWALTAVGVAALAAVAAGRVGGERRGPLLVLATPAAATYVAVLVSAWSIYQRTGQPAGLQGRYLYGGLVGLVAAVAVGAHALTGRGARWTPPVALAAGVAAQAVAVLAVLRHWYGAADAGLGERLLAVMAWSPLPPVATAALGALAALTAALALTGLVRAARADATPR